MQKDSLKSLDFFQEIKFFQIKRYYPLEENGKIPKVIRKEIKFNEFSLIPFLKSSSNSD